MSTLTTALRPVKPLAPSYADVQPTLQMPISEIGSRNGTQRFQPMSLTSQRPIRGSQHPYSTSTPCSKQSSTIQKSMDSKMRHPIAVIVTAYGRIKSMLHTLCKRSSLRTWHSYSGIRMRLHEMERVPAQNLLHRISQSPPYPSLYSSSIFQCLWVRDPTIVNCNFIFSSGIPEQREEFPFKGSVFYICNQFYHGRMSFLTEQRYHWW